MLEPQYSSLNHDQVMLKAILLLHLLLNPTPCEADNNDDPVKYGNLGRFGKSKRYMVCVLSLDHTEPIFLPENIKSIVEDNEQLIREWMSTYLENECKLHHESVVAFVLGCHWKIHHSNEKTLGMEDVIDVYVSQKCDKRCPPYIRDTLEDLVDDNITEALNKLPALLDTNLKRAVKSYMRINKKRK